MEFKQGDRIDHEKYGEGIISKVNLSSYEAIFIRGGKVSLTKISHGLTLIEAIQSSTENRNENESGINFTEIMETLEAVLEKHNGISHKVTLGDKWQGGNMVLQPANKDLKPKEISIDSFFRKIVLLRDRLRVLEQNINSHSVLSDEDKINLQQYITRCYGSLTTFNILFDDKKDFFVGTGGKNE